MSHETPSERKLYACGYNGFAQLPLKDNKLVASRAIPSLEQCIFCPARDSRLAHCLAVGWSRCFFKKGKDIFKYGGSSSETSGKSVMQNVDSTESIHCFNDTLFTTLSSTSSNICRETTASKLEALRVQDQEAGDVKVVTLDSNVNSLFALTDKGAGKLDQSGKSLIYKKVFTDVQVDALSCGKEHVLLLTKAGVVLTFGAGSRGQLGHGDVQDKVEAPTQVDAIAAVPITVIAAGGWHSVAVSEYGDLYIWGWNVNGQLGFPKQPLRGPPEVVSSPPTKRRRNRNDDPYKDQSPANSPKDLEEVPSTEGDDSARGDSLAVSFLTSPQILDMSPPREILVKSASCGSRHTAAVTRDGRLYTWGFGRWGQLGHGDEWTRDCPTIVDSFRKNSKVLDVYCKEWNTFAVVEDNTL